LGTHDKAEKKKGGPGKEIEQKSGQYILYVNIKNPGESALITKSDQGTKGYLGKGPLWGKRPINDTSSRKASNHNDGTKSQETRKRGGDCLCPERVSILNRTGGI